jgi:hypothetical protein
MYKVQLLFTDPYILQQSGDERQGKERKRVMAHTGDEIVEPTRG